MESKLKALIGIAVGLGLELATQLLCSAGDSNILFVLAIFLVATLLFIWGCTHYALSKGLPHWLGYLGIFNFLGPIVIFLLPSRRRVAHD
jgi:hypothetical protein